MGLIDALGGDDLVRRPECTIKALLLSLPDKERDALLAAMNNPAKSHTFISRVLRDEGHNISSNTVGRHRRGDCSCGS